MFRTTCVCFLWAAALACLPVWAQESPAPAAPAVWSAGPVDFSGLVDGYYSLNFNHPSSKSNSLRNFDARANQFSLNMAKLTLEHSPGPVGFRVDLGFGKAFEIIHASDVRVRDADTIFCNPVRNKTPATCAAAHVRLQALIESVKRSATFACLRCRIRSRRRTCI